MSFKQSLMTKIGHPYGNVNMSQSSQKSHPPKKQVTVETCPVQFVLKWAREEVCPKLNQYGGEPAASATQLLVETMDNVTSSLEDNRAGVVLSAVDFSKAFNRLDHGHCLKSLIARGSSSNVIQMLATFLEKRTMMEMTQIRG